MGLLLLLVACRAGGAEERGVIAGDESRVVVEVLNGTTVRGLARRGVQVLRDRGLDVVAYGNADAPADSTRVLVRRGPTAHGTRVARALGAGVVEVVPDTLRRVDVTVILGMDYQPPVGPRP